MTISRENSYVGPTKAQFTNLFYYELIPINSINFGIMKIYSFLYIKKEKKTKRKKNKNQTKFVKVHARRRMIANLLNSIFLVT